MAITVEFVGYAGSGKTFLKDRLVALLGGEACEVSSDVRLRVGEALRFVVCHPGRVWSVLWLVVTIRPEGLRFAFQAFMKMFAYEVKLGRGVRQGAKFIVFDEGMLHRFRMLRSGSRRAGLSYSKIDARIRRKMFGRADLVILVVASLETTAIRRLERGEKKALAQGIEKLVQGRESIFAASLERTEDDILQAQTEHGFRYLRIVNDEPSAVEGNLRRIREEITKLERMKASLPSLVEAEEGI